MSVHDNLWLLDPHHPGVFHPVAKKELEIILDYDEMNYKPHKTGGKTFTPSQQH